MGTRHRGGIGFSYRPARLHRLAEFNPWNQFRGPINIKKYGLWSGVQTGVNTAEHSWSLPEQTGVNMYMYLVTWS
jgi:hypothetical protein